MKLFSIIAISIFTTSFISSMDTGTAQEQRLQCTVNIQKLGDLHSKYRQIADIKILVTRDLDGNCPTVFVTMPEQHVADFSKDPLVLKYQIVE